MTIRILLLVVIAVAILNCSEDDRPNDLPLVEERIDENRLIVDTTFQYCDSVFIATYSGTACCVSGPTVAKPGDILRYHYQINHSDAHVSWQILAGDIKIIAGQTTPTVTVEFGPDFTTGIVYADGNGIPRQTPSRQRCTDRAIISKK